MLSARPAGSGSAARYACLTHGLGTGAGVHMLPHIRQVARSYLLVTCSADSIVSSGDFEEPSCAASGCPSVLDSVVFILEYSIGIVEHVKANYVNCCSKI